MSNLKQSGTASALVWRKSSYSGGNGGECVEVAVGAPGMLVRDSKLPHRAHLALPLRSWSAMTASIAASQPA